MKSCNGTKSGSVFRDVYYRSIYSDDIQRKRLLNSAKDSLDYVQRLAQSSILKVHKGCVNTVFWNRSGQLLLSGSDDCNLILTDPFSGKIQLRYKSLHRANIFSAKFLPGSDRRIISCSGDGVVGFTDLTYPPTSQDQINEANQNYFNCHSGSTSYEVLAIPNEPEIFMSCGEDATIRLYDLRKESKCHKTKCKDNILISSPSAVTTMDVAPISMFYLAVGSSDGYVRIYDRRYLSLMEFSETETNFTIPVKAFSIPAVEKRAYRITSVGYSEDEQEILASYSSEHLYLFDATQEGLSTKASLTEKNKRSAKTGGVDSPPPVRRLRLRGDWTDTGPESRPSWEGSQENPEGRSPAASTVMSRMTEVLSRMLSDTNRTNFQGNEIPNDHDLDIVNTLQNLTDPSGDASRYERDERMEEGETSGQDEMPRDIEEQEDFEMKQPLNYSHIKQKYTGHRNSRTMIKESTFYGNNYVMSGSDCGHIFVWNKHTGRLVNVLQGDKHVVNCIQPHPTLNVIATSGIDYDIKIWAPTDESSNFNEPEAEDLMKRNDIMLKETRDTITVPASFMILLLSSLSRSRPVTSATPRYQNLIQNLRQRNRDRRSAQEARNNEEAEGNVEPEVARDEEMMSDDEEAINTNDVEIINNPVIEEDD